jgi:hypothetical protein
MRLGVGRQCEDVVKEERASASLIELVPEHQGMADAMRTDHGPPLTSLART